MSEINSFITSFCAGCILLGFTYMLCPSGSMNNSVKYVFCLCFVCCIVATALSMPTPDFTYFDSTHDKQLLTEQNTSVTAQTVFCEALRSQNINFRKITVDTNKMLDGSIIINKVTIYSSEDPQKIKQVIEADSYEVAIINE